MNAPILQVITATHRRGAEVYAVDLRDELRRQGMTMDLVALRAATSSGALDVPVLARSRHRAIPELRARARHARGILAHGSDTLLAASLATVGTTVPFVYRSIGDPRFWSHRADRRLRVGLELRRARTVACTFEAAAEALVADYGLDPDRVTVIPNGRPVDRFPSPTADERAQTRADLLPDVDGPVILFLGALSQEKDPVAAVRAVAQLPEVHLLIVGDGPLRGVVEAYAASVAPGRVHVLGALADPRPAYLASQALVLPSRTEGFPGVAIEAALCCLPVVATDVGGVRSVVHDGVTGRIVATSDRGLLADALNDVLGRADLMGAAGRQHCLAHFDMAVIAREWHTLLDRVLP